MKKRIVVVVIVALAVAGYLGWQYFAGGGAASDDTLGGSGTIEAEQIAITPQVTGRIVGAPAEEGVPVKKGDVLYRLDASLLQLAVEQAQAGADAAVVNYSHVKGDSDAHRGRQGRGQGPARPGPRRPEDGEAAGRLRDDRLPDRRHR